MQPQTSFHRLNADGKMNPVQRVLWLIYNYINNGKPMQDVDAQLHVSKYQFQVAKDAADLGESKSSPSRCLSDMFWAQLPWPEISEVLHGNIKVAEFGCGSGRYGKVLEKHLGTNFGGYLGLDIQKSASWVQLADNPKYEFVVGNSNNSTDYLRDANFVITQSALEHFDDDLVFMQQVAQWIEEQQRPIIQVHLLPSADCLWTYLWHGVRQYTPRTISKFTRLFGDNTEKHLFELGGANGNAIHRHCYTRPMLLRKSMPTDYKGQPYDQARDAAIFQDLEQQTPGQACFYALVLASNLNRQLFAG